MSEQCVALNKSELPWTTWQLICVKFKLDPSTTNDILLYTNRAISMPREGNHEKQ